VLNEMRDKEFTDGDPQGKTRCSVGVTPLLEAQQVACTCVPHMRILRSFSWHVSVRNTTAITTTTKLLTPFTAEETCPRQCRPSSNTWSARCRLQVSDRHRDHGDGSGSALFSANGSGLMVLRSLFSASQSSGQSVASCDIPLDRSCRCGWSAVRRQCALLQKISYRSCPK